VSKEQLQKLRRFSLALGVILFSYVVIGFEPVITEGKARINFPLMAFNVERHDFIPIGIALGSFWGMLLFWYYGFMVNRSPYRRRKELLGGAKRLNAEHNYGVDGLSDSEVLEHHQALIELYPRFLARDILFKVTETQLKTTRQKTHGETEEFPAKSRVEFGITERQIVVARFRDVDYSAPIWVNAIALLTWSYSIGVLREVVIATATLGTVIYGSYWIHEHWYGIRKFFVGKSRED